MFPLNLWRSQKWHVACAVVKSSHQCCQKHAASWDLGFKHVHFRVLELVLWVDFVLWHFCLHFVCKLRWIVLFLVSNYYWEKSEDVCACKMILLWYILISSNYHVMVIVLWMCAYLKPISTQCGFISMHVCHFAWCYLKKMPQLWR